MTTALQDIQNFLPCKTPDRWLENALDNQTLMLIDHANCDKKAASTAMNLILRLYKTETAEDTKGE